MSVVVGVDGGATKTQCVILERTSQTELARATGSASNWNSTGLDRAVEAVAATVEEALRISSKAQADVAGTCFGLAGADRDEDKDRLNLALRARLDLQAPSIVQNDAIAALCGGTLGELKGVILIAGTGTIAVGVQPGGQEARACGWGPAFLDGGCGFDLGQKALLAVAKELDGRGPQTALTTALCQHCKVTSPRDLLGWVYADQEWSRIASLAPAVLTCEFNSDPVASEIARQACEDLVCAAAAAAGRCNFANRYPLILSGGLLHHTSPFAQRCRYAIQQQLPAADVQWPKADAATGAAMLMSKYLQREAQS